MTLPTTRADRAVVDGLELVGIVRDYGTDSIAEFVRKRDRAALEALVVTLAAMVDDTKSAGELLAWCDPDQARREQERRKRIIKLAQQPREAQPCGTHAAFNKHKNRNEPPCDLCVLGERVYQRERMRRRRQEAAA